MTPGRKDDHGKPRADLEPPRAQEELWRVLGFGAVEYGPNNWHQVEDLRNRYVAAALRHINSFRQGKTLDVKSGLHHLAHAVCSLMFVLEDELERSVADTTHGQTLEGAPVLPGRHANLLGLLKREDSPGD